MKQQVVLSLFPGVGMLDHAFESEGFFVTRGPDVIFSSLCDIRTYRVPADVFTGIIGGPPCQSFSSLAHLVRANGYEPKFGNLIPEFERCIQEAQVDWFVMENVRAAPEPVVQGYGVTAFLLDNAALAGDDAFGQEQTRLRKFCFGMRGVERVPDLRRWIDLAVFMLPEADVASFGDGRLTRERPKWIEEHGQPRTRRQAVVSDPSAVPVKIGGSGKVKRTARAGREPAENDTAVCPISLRHRRRHTHTGSGISAER